MENTSSLNPADLGNLSNLLNSASWEVGALVAPTCEPTDSDDSDSEVR